MRTKNDDTDVQPRKEVAAITNHQLTCTQFSMLFFYLSSVLSSFCLLYQIFLSSCLIFFFHWLISTVHCLYGWKEQSQHVTFFSFEGCGSDNFYQCSLVDLNVKIGTDTCIKESYLRKQNIYTELYYVYSCWCMKRKQDIALQKNFLIHFSLKHHLHSKEISNVT